MVYDPVHGCCRGQEMSELQFNIPNPLPKTNLPEFVKMYNSMDCMDIYILDKLKDLRTALRSQYGDDYGFAAKCDELTNQVFSVMNDKYK